MATTTFDMVRPRTRPRFYVGMAAVFVLIAFGGFIPTYWAKVATGTFHGAPIYHLHGLVLFSWTLYYFVQTALVAAGRTLDHRNWGLLGIALATAICFTVVLAEITTMRAADAAGFGDAARRFEAISFVGIIVFATLFIAAIVNIRRAEWHKRLMIMAVIPMMHAAMARVFLTLLAPPHAADGPPPPLFVTVPPGLTVDLLLVAAMIYDWRTRGRVHPAYLVGVPFVVASQLLIPAIGDSAAWMTAARALEGLMG
ncbi:MAG: hypothetical protein ACRYG4_19550 [Janthinobacterium lividum]